MHVSITNYNEMDDQKNLLTIILENKTEKVHDIIILHLNNSIPANGTILPRGRSQIMVSLFSGQSATLTWARHLVLVLRIKNNTNNNINNIRNSACCCDSDIPIFKSINYKDFPTSPHHQINTNGFDAVDFVSMLSWRLLSIIQLKKRPTPTYSLSLFSIYINLATLFYVCVYIYLYLYITLQPQFFLLRSKFHFRYFRMYIDVLSKLML